MVLNRLLKNSIFQFQGNLSKCERFKISYRNYNRFILDSAFIAGKWIKPSLSYDVKTPFNGKTIGKAPMSDETLLNQAIEASKVAFKTWSILPARERSLFINKLYELHLKYKEELAMIITLEMGKPITESRSEILYGASFLQWFSEQSKRINGEILQSPWPDKVLYYVKEPIGPVAIITPWNFPNAMITRKLAAVLASGCTAVICPAYNTPFSALAICKMAEEAGFPPGVINIVPTIRSIAVNFGKIFCKHNDISGISFTGSTNVGKILIEQSSSTIKRLSLELGGNASFIVFESADLDKAVDGCMVSKFRNTGQTCICTNRIYVQNNIYEKFVEKLASRILQLKVGDPTLEDTTIGPLVNKDAVIKVKEHVQDATSKGGKIIVGGKQYDSTESTLFYQPTLISNVKQNMRVCNEETFGPLAAVIKFDCEEEVINLANDTKFGLASYFYSKDLAQIRRVARSLKTGILGINEGIVSCAEAPFGGIKESGIGREGSHFGIDEFINIKYICHGSL